MKFKTPSKSLIIIVIIGSLSTYGVAYYGDYILDCQDAVNMTPEECEAHFKFGWNVLVPSLVFGMAIFLLVVLPQILELIPQRNESSPKQQMRGSNNDFN